MDSIDFQSGGRNQHYGRILYWLAGCLTQQFPELTVNMKIGPAYQNLSAVGDGLAQVGIATPGMMAALCYEGNGPFDRPRPALRAIGVVPHRDALVFAIIHELGVSSLEELRERHVPVRLAAAADGSLVGRASRSILALHGITQESIERDGGQWIVTEGAQACWRLVAHGEADAMINESIPQSFRPLSKARPIRLLSFHEDAARELQAEQGYRWRVVPAGTVYNQDQPVIGLDWQHWIVVAHADLPHEIAYSLADAFFREPVRLERQYTADNRLAAEDVSMEAPMRPEAVANEVCVPLHPGAEARYREAGVLSDG